MQKRLCRQSRALAALLPRQRRDLRVGQRAARFSRKGGLPFRCLARHLIAAQGHRRAILFVEAAMNALRRPAFPQWKIDLVRDGLTFIEGEMGGPVTAATIARIPSLSMAEIQKAMNYQEAQRRLARS